MASEELGGNIILNGFDLDVQEKIIVKKMIGKYAEKIRDKIGYDKIQLTMQKHKEVKTEKYEIQGLVVFGKGRAVAEAEGFNPFMLIDEVMQKIIKEIGNKVKK